MHLKCFCGCNEILACVVFKFDVCKTWIVVWNALLLYLRILFKIWIILKFFWVRILYKCDNTHNSQYKLYTYHCHFPQKIMIKIIKKIPHVRDQFLSYLTWKMICLTENSIQKNKYKIQSFSLKTQELLSNAMIIGLCRRRKKKKEN